MYVWCWPTRINYMIIMIQVGLARTVYIHRIWPYIWWFPCQKYRICTVYIWFWPTLFIGCFYMVLKGPFLNGTRLPVDQILLMGWWYLPIALPNLKADLLPVSYFVNAVIKLNHLDYAFGCPQFVCQLSCIPTLSFNARARLWNGCYMMDIIHFLFLPLHQTLVLYTQIVSLGS